MIEKQEKTFGLCESVSKYGISVFTLELALKKKLTKDMMLKKTRSCYLMYFLVCLLNVILI